MDVKSRVKHYINDAKLKSGLGVALEKKQKSKRITIKWSEVLFQTIQYTSVLNN